MAGAGQELTARRVLWLPPALHLAVLAAYLCSRIVRPGGAVGGVVALVDEFLPLAFLPLPLWVVAAAVARSRRAFLAAAGPWWAFALLYGGLFVPPELRPGLTVQGPTIRVMSFNVLVVNQRPEWLAEAVRAARPDLLAVQELGTLHAAGLDRLLATSYPYRLLEPARTPDGMGIWSRYPFVPTERPAGLRWQEVVVSIDGRALRLVNFHPLPPDPHFMPLLGGVGGPVALDSRQRTADVDAALRALRDTPTSGEAVVLAGDLNMSDQTPEYRRLTAAGLVDAHRQVGLGFGSTFPSHPITRWRGLPVPPGSIVRIDYVLVGGPLAVQAARVWPDAAGSDHFPVVADLAWRWP